eukprot:scaffold31532_cov19-Tisochrysis_lutea.AAC.1
MAHLQPASAQARLCRFLLYQPLLESLLHLEQHAGSGQPLRRRLREGEGVQPATGSEKDSCGREDQEKEVAPCSTVVHNGDTGISAEREDGSTSRIGRGLCSSAASSRDGSD